MPMTTRQRFRGITDWFQQNMPVAESELQYQNPYQLLVSVTSRRSAPTNA